MAGKKRAKERRIWCSSTISILPSCSTGALVSRRRTRNSSALRSLGTIRPVFASAIRWRNDHSFSIRWRRRSMSQSGARKSPNLRDGGYAKDIVGANTLFGQGDAEVKRHAIPDHLGISIAQQDVAAFPQFEKNLVQHAIENLIVINVDFVSDLAVDSLEIKLVFGHGYVLG